MEKAMYLVINVDDLGLHPAVKRAVDSLSAKGLITSSTILANSPYVEDAVGTRGIGLGVHLNILRGRPVARPGEVSSLLNQDGLFPGSFGEFFRKYLGGRLNFREIEREWDAQIVRIRDLGVKPTHFDSEKHLHCLPGLMEIACSLAGRHGVGWVRRTVERTPLFAFDKGALRTKFLNACALFHKEQRSVRRPDAVWGVRYQGDEPTPDLLASYLSGLGKRSPGAMVVEFVCHPGLELPGDPPLTPEFGKLRINYQWDAEYRALTERPWGDMYRREGIELVNYGEIKP